MDKNTHSNYQAFQTKYLKWAIDVDFEHSIINGTAEYMIKCVGSESAICLDSSFLKIKSVHVDGQLSPFSEATGKFGGILSVPVASGADEVSLRIDYCTTEKCTAAQWLSPAQTFGKECPFLFTQCQAIHARTLIPCQDSPSVKFCYEATVTVPPGLTALMSALSVPNDSPDTFSFKQPVPVPAYLLALAVGDLQGVRIGPRSTVWAEPAIVQSAAEEFVDTESFLATAESIAGPYVWGVYDLLVLPSSFPYGGMENPCLTFLSPSLIAKDRSLVDVVAHEIAHSWTGNLVTNATWEAFWLNEGFTMFLERKITGRLRGEPYRHFDALLGLTDLRKDVFDMFGPESPATALCPDLSNADPDEVYSRVPYEKGHTFLFYLESLIGEGPFGDYLRAHLNEFAYKSVAVEEWKDYLMQYFARSQEIREKLQSVDWQKWLYGAGMPPVVPDYDQSLCLACKQLASLYSV